MHFRQGDISDNRCQDIVEIMGNPTCQDADRFNFPGILKFLFNAFFIGYITKDNYNTHDFTEPIKNWCRTVFDEIFITVFSLEDITAGEFYDLLGLNDFFHQIYMICLVVFIHNMKNFFKQFAGRIFLAPTCEGLGYLIKHNNGAIGGC